MSRIMIAVMCVALASESLLAADIPTTAPSTLSHSSKSASTDQPLPELRFNGAALSDCIDFLAQASGANIMVDWRALDAAKVSKDTPITLRLTSAVSLRKALKLTLQSAGGVGVLTFYVDDGVIQITSQDEADKDMITKLYPIGDLLFSAPDFTQTPNLDITQVSSQGGGGGGAGGGGGGGGQSLFGGSGGGSSQSTANNEMTRAQRADEIIKLITDTIRPEIWKVNGGTASISFYRDHLVVTAPRSVHELLSSQSVKQ